ncbi:MAG: TetR/AcrR family transcriptional regulator [Gammaproteobacteria bacterium]
MLTNRPVGLYIDKMVTERETQAISTRNNILDIATQEILRCGFQSSSIGEIIKKANISKGCFYHHFSTKQALGYAVLDETLIKMKHEMWYPILSSDNPLQSIIEMYINPENYLDCESVKHGCPINNLAQEMSPIDEGFRTRIENIYTQWREQLSIALKESQQSGKMSKDVDADEISTLIMAVTQGAIGIAKNAQNPESFTEYTHGLLQYLQKLKLNN